MGVTSKTTRIKQGITPGGRTYSVTKNRKGTFSHVRDNATGDSFTKIHQPESRYVGDRAKSGKHKLTYIGKSKATKFHSNDRQEQIFANVVKKGPTTKSSSRIANELSEKPSGKVRKVSLKKALK